MFKGIIEFIKWWCGKDFFPPERNDNPTAASEEFDPLDNPFLTSWQEADEAAEKISQRFGEKSWLNLVAVEVNEKYGHVVRIGIDPEILQLKPEEFEYFNFVQEVDGVQVFLVPVEMARALGAEKK